MGHLKTNYDYLLRHLRWVQRRIKIEYKGQFLTKSGLKIALGNVQKDNASRKGV